MYNENMFELITAVAVTAAKDYKKASNYVNTHPYESKYKKKMRLEAKECEWFLGEDICRDIDRYGVAGFFARGYRG